eukprot:NODE_6039_length_658_cov_20.364532_g1993_i1.p2 GENE.NODE_6039_length_658_cov_20.364532_g1993_i1~~NODE_6039_length_658_cov_20.364532_g1993_i1.p2  ORF type:complete len:130 (-),score=15.97 NODE_6039_length_658_cov_20.364532_g1993_i1:68-457(-)
MCGWLGATVRYLQLVFLCSYVQDIDDEEDVCVPFCADPGILRTLERLAALLRGCQEGTQAFEDAWLQLPLSLRLWAVSFFGWDKGYRPYLVALCAFVDQKTGGLTLAVVGSHVGLASLFRRVPAPGHLF